MRARIGAAFSPTPAVKTKASRPPSAAASWPAMQRAAVDEVVDREGRAGSSLASRSRMSFETPERPLRPAPL